MLTGQRRTLPSMHANDGTGQQGHYPPRHTWVDGSSPGIVLEWRTVDGRWEAFVVWADGQAGAHMEWLPADRVAPK